LLPGLFPFQQCDREFNALSLGQRVMDAFASCDKQAHHEKHLNPTTTPVEGPFRYGRLAGRDETSGRIVYFCQCVEHACTVDVPREMVPDTDRFLLYVAHGMRPNWTPANHPTVACRGGRSLHIHFTARRNRTEVQIEVVNTSHVDPKIPFARFGEHFEDRVHLVPGDPQSVTDYMIEGLEPENA
jgi:hypothetical protein